MFTPARISCLLLALAAGCASPSKDQSERTPPSPGKGAAWQRDTLSKPQATSTNEWLPPVFPKFTNAPAAKLPGSNAPATNLPPPTVAESGPAWIPLRRWIAGHHGSEPHLVAKLPLPTYGFAVGGKVFGVQVGSRVASCNNVELHLGFAPQVVSREVCVHSLDLKKNFEALLENDFAAADNRVVVIDPGHGGINAGARNVASGGWEKEYTLDWARRLAPLLEERGWKVFLTRTNDTDLSLGDRVAVAEGHHADLFLSLHFNSSAESGHEQPGLETLCLTPTGMPSDITRDFPDNPREVFPNNAFDADNVRWAMRVQSALLKADGLADRGVRRARFPGVLRTQKRPAVLIEGGFVSNPAEARRIASAEHRQQLAEALAAAFGELEVNGQKTEAAVTNSTSTRNETRTIPTP